MEEVIIIKNLVGLNAVSMNKGIILYTLLFDKLKNNKHVTLDFSNVLVASPFFNASISYLLKNFDLNFIIKMIKIIELDESSKNILNISIHNAVEKYKK